jgi:hypothetical protein
VPPATAAPTPPVDPLATPAAPSTAPSAAPSTASSTAPSAAPSTAPSAAPSTAPSAAPSGSSDAILPDDELNEAATRYGVAPHSTLEKAWTIAGRTVHGEPARQQFLKDLAAADRGKSDIRKQIDAAAIKAGVVGIKSTASAKQISAALDKFVADNDLTSASSIEEAAKILDVKIREAVEKDKKDQTSPLLQKWAQLHEALTGTMPASWDIAVNGVQKPAVKAPTVTVAATTAEAPAADAETPVLDRVVSERVSRQPRRVERTDGESAVFARTWAASRARGGVGEQR